MSANTFSSENIIIRKLNKEEILTIYTTHSIRHFPADERKPVSSIQRMAEEGIYTGYGLFAKSDPAKLLCYAFFTVLQDRRNILLDYFAVMEDYRSHGIGSLFLRHMKSSVTDYDGFIIETEDPDFSADKTELSVRNKRLCFYARNGAEFTGILAEVFGVHYRILFFPILAAPDVKTLFSDFDMIYQKMVSRKNYESHVRIFLHNTDIH